MRLSQLVMAGLLGLATGPAPSADGTAARSDPEFGPPVTLGDRVLPFAEAVRVGPLLYLSGQVGLPPGASELVDGGITAETRQTLENIKRIVERHGSSMARIVKCQVFLADMSEWDAMNGVYVSFFPVDPPARSSLGVTGLALGARIEIECLAVVDDSSHDASLDP